MKTTSATGNQSNRLNAYSKCSILGLFITATVLSVSVGCSPRAGGGPVLSEQTAPFVFDWILDTSASNRAYVGLEIGSMGTVSLYLDSRNHWLNVYRCDSSTLEIRSDVPPHSDEELIKEVVPRLAPLSGKDNTLLHVALSVVTDRVATRSGKTVIVLASDGYGEGMDANARQTLRAVAATLAKNERVLAVFLEGVAPANVLQLRRDLQPISSKLRFVGAGRLDSAVINSLVNEEVSK